jgi:ATP-dependent Clp protease ATP-binding subunit ClpC
MAPTTYENALSEGRPVTREAQDHLPAAFRGELVIAAARALKAGRSVLFSGPSGVGKSAVVRALAIHLEDTGEREVYEYSCVQLLSGTLYLGEWQSKVTALLDQAKKSQTLLYFTDIWNLVTTGRSSSSKDTVWDAIRPRLLAGDVQLLGEVDEQQLLTLGAVGNFTAPFEIIEVPPLSGEQIAEVVRAEAARLKLALSAGAASRLLELCHHFLPSSVGPGPAMRLTGQIRNYFDEEKVAGETPLVDAALVEKVFSLYSGLPRFVVSRKEVLSTASIRDWFRARIIGQQDAIDAVVQMITLFKAGMHDARKPIGSFLFMGPTGVGKTELARTLASYIFGSEKRLLRFDLSEFKDYYSFQMLIGDPDKPDRPARLTDPVRAQPFQIVLLDEIEKAHSNVWDLLLQLLDDGRVTPARGAAVSFRNTIVIATTNVGSAALDHRPVGFAGGLPAGDPERFQAELETVFRPELLNRFQHIVRFLRLTKEEVQQIARAEAAKALEREGIVGRQLVVDVGNDVLDLVVARGYDERYGARALKRQLQRLVVVPIATVLVERDVPDASILRLSVRAGEVVVTVLDSEQSREQRGEAQPLKLARGQKVSREELTEMLQRTQAQLAEIATGIELATLAAKRAELEGRRSDADLFKDPRAAALLLAEVDQLDRVIERMERLQAEQAHMSEAMQKSTRREQLRRALEPIQRHIGHVDQAHRELLRIGPEGYSDALLEIRPIGEARPARDLLYKTYTAWAKERKLQVRMVREPLSNEDPVMIAVAGPYAYGYLAGETGLHRLRTGEDTCVVKVTVVVLPGTAARPAAADRLAVAAQKALKQMGQYGGPVRSRVELAGSALVVQNAGSVAESLELAEELAPLWPGADGAGEHGVVRRYDLEPFLLRDFRTGTKTGRADTLHPGPFHELLCKRVDSA